jgi:hypothetical protein
LTYNQHREYIAHHVSTYKSLPRSLGSCCHAAFSDCVAAFSYCPPGLPSLTRYLAAFGVYSSRYSGGVLHIHVCVGGAQQLRISFLPTNLAIIALCRRIPLSYCLSLSLSLSLYIYIYIDRGGDGGLPLNSTLLVMPRTPTHYFSPKARPACTCRAFTCWRASRCLL